MKTRKEKPPFFFISCFRDSIWHSIQVGEEDRDAARYKYGKNDFPDEGVTIRRP